MPKRNQSSFESNSKAQKTAHAGDVRAKPRRTTKSFRKQVQMIVKGMSEKKDVLTTLNQVFNATQSMVQTVNNVAEGTDFTNRVGREVAHAYIEVDLTIFVKVPTTGNAALGDCGFWALVLDRQANGSAAVFTDIFDDSAALGQQGLSFKSTFQYQNRFHILCREEWATATPGTYVVTAGVPAGATGSVPYHIKKYVDLSKLRAPDNTVRFATSGGTIAAMDSGVIYFVCASTFSNANATTQILGQTKYRFTDL